jgi:pyruvate,orthophosphate dikinase
LDHEFAVLQAARLKGRLSSEAAAAACGIDVNAAADLLSSLRDAGLFKGEASVRLTPQGRERLAGLVSAERDGTDTAALTGLYEEFDEHNTELKDTISAWQLRNGEPNDHSDEAYDQSVIDRLAALDAAFQPLVARIVEVAPRLKPYPQRFAAALSHINSGDTSYVARPVTDSYHTVWFEFHEELIGLLGLNREQEAAAGRAV